MCFLITVWVFFFSSRRRHTRLVSDWSSDVCSSDLVAKHRARRNSCGREPGGHELGVLDADAERERSEERRVGKECRSRGWAEHEKKNKTEDNVLGRDWKRLYDWGGVGSNIRARRAR